LVADTVTDAVTETDAVTDTDPVDVSELDPVIVPEGVTVRDEEDVEVGD